MNLAPINLSAKPTMANIAAMALILGLVGCGKSEQAAERKAGRQRFKEAVAAVKVRTQGSTYSEFRKVELDLKTSFEANKTYVDDVRVEFAELSEVMSACDHLWDHSVRYPNSTLDPNRKADLEAMEVFKPGIAAKSNLNWDQREKDPDFFAGNYVKRGLTKISALCETILDALTPKN